MANIFGLLTMCELRWLDILAKYIFLHFYGPRWSQGSFKHAKQERDQYHTILTK